MKRLLIGIPTYNDYQRIDYLLNTIEGITDFSGIDREIVILDDGTRDKLKLQNLKEVADEYNIRLIEHGVNKGIPASWNSLSRASDSEYICLFNDDIGIVNENWAQCLLYFLEHNENIGSAGFSLIQIDPTTGARDNSKDKGFICADDKPGRCGAAVGCSFGFTRKYFDLIGGFWEGLVSFHEESHFGFLGAKQGYYSYMLPYPAVEHRGSRTFAENTQSQTIGNRKELAVRILDDSCISRERYLEIVTPFLDHVLENGAMPFKCADQFWSRIGENEYTPTIIGDYVDRMNMSRAMFADYWGVTDHLENPAIPVHQKYVDPATNTKTIKYLNSDMEEKECVI